jgi:hypothetical protein
VVLVRIQLRAPEIMINIYCNGAFPTRDHPNRFAVSDEARSPTNVLRLIVWRHNRYIVIKNGNQWADAQKLTREEMKECREFAAKKTAEYREVIRSRS